MPRIQVDLPTRDLGDIAPLTGDSVWPDAEAAVRYMVADYLEQLAWTPEYHAWVQAKLAEVDSDVGESRDMDEVFDELEARLATLASKAS